MRLIAVQLCLLLQVISAGTAFAQTRTAEPIRLRAERRNTQEQGEIDNDFGLWIPFLCQVPLTRNRRLQISSETSPRFTKDLERFEQILLRNNVLFAVNRHCDLQVGHVFARTFFPRPFNDNRINAQISGDIRLGKSALYGRLRLEERFIEHAGKPSVRLRPTIRLTRPIYSDRVFAFCQNELFLNLNTVQNGPYAGFDQNRLLAGVGFRIYKQLRFDVAYLNQYLNRRGNADKINHILWLGTTQSF